MRRLFLLLAAAPLIAGCDDDPTATTSRDPRVTVALQVGQAYTATAAEVDTLMIDGPAGAEYVLVPFFADTVGSARLLFDVQATGLAAPQGPPSPMLSPGGAAPLLSLAGTASPRADQRGFETRLRRLERTELTPRITGAPAAPQPGKEDLHFARAAAVPKEVGDTMIINVRVDDACAGPVYRTGRVAAITQRAVVVADVQNPLGGFTDAEYQDLGVAFDTLVWPVNVANFGEPRDVDQNGRVILFYTGAVNDLTEAGADAVTLGFFFARDLFPRQDGTIDGVRLKGCPGSNLAEIFYMVVPDPVRATSQPVYSKTAVRRSTVGTLGHEFQHLINASRRLFVVKASGEKWQEETWLNEGLSHIAEELLFYRVSGLAPGRNIGYETLKNEGAIDEFNEYGIDNLSRFLTYLENPDTASLVGRDDLPTRGASWAFLRYAADRRGGDQQALWRNLVNTDRTGIANVNAVFGARALEWMQEWTASVYVDDAGFAVEPKLSQPSWNFRSLVAALKNSSGQVSYPQFPIRTTRLDNGAVSFEIYAGGGAFARFAQASSGPAELRLVQRGGSASLDDGRLRFSIVRTR